MWFCSTIVLTVLSLALAIGMCVMLLQDEDVSVEPRLIGTWISDVNKTIEMLPASFDSESESFQRLKTFVGKMKVTYSANGVAFDLDGEVNHMRYRILGTDDYSCVIESISEGDEMEKQLMDLMKASRFSVIHFEDTSLYWVQSPIGGFAEYFRRVPD